ncbi:MAG: SDR family NAD(P)-dependent oxidoreductase [Pseudomonadota bacterium]
MPTILLTGATSGLGHATARILLRDPKLRLILGARNPTDPRLAEFPAERFQCLPLDLTDLAAVRRFADAVEGPLEGVALNAGIQVTGGLTRTADGYETDVAANHLGHAALIAALGDKIAPGASIVTTGSGTHAAEDRIARLFGFKGGHAVSVYEMAKGIGDDGAQGDRDRYATSKLAQTAWTLGRARHDVQRTWLVFDPGLMPGTALARDRSAAEQFAWNHVLPRLRPLIRGVSSAEQSATQLARLLRTGTAASGPAIDHMGRPALLSATAKASSWQDQVVEETPAILGS